jgi:sec-independent protein translocase protein TatA
MFEMQIIKEKSMLGSIGPQELIVILLIVVIIFGARRLPELGKSLGEGIKNFKNSVSGKDKDKDHNPPSPKTPPPSQS